MAYSFRRKTSDGYNILQSEIPFEVPDNLIQASKTANPTSSIQYIHPDTGYDGLAEVVVNSVTGSEPNLLPENIRDGVEMFNITGTWAGGELQEKSVTPSSSEQIVTPDTGKYGLSKVTVASAASGDPNLIPENIALGVTIYGVTGTHEGGYGSTTDIYVGSESGVQVGDLFIRDTNLVAGNIKRDVSIFGVTGTFDGGSLQSKSVTPSASQQTITPDSPNYGLSSVIVAGDSDLIPSNIRKDVNIFGVTGSYEGGGSGSGGLSYSESTASSGGTIVSIDTTAGGYGYTDNTSTAASGGLIREFSGLDLGRNPGSLITCQLGTNIDRVVCVFGSNTFTGLIVNHVGYMNIPYPYTGTVTVKAYYGSTLMNSGSVNISSIGSYTCTLS